MKKQKDSIKFELAGFDYETIENYPHSIFCLDKDLKLSYFNKAWFEFSKENHGEPIISSKFKIGTPIEKAISGTIREFYISNYRRVLKDLVVWKHEYECSSPTLYRLFCQDAYPLKNAAGIIIVNSLKIEKPIHWEEPENANLSIEDYTDKNGLITQCSNCRKTQRVNNNTIWDWVPSFVTAMPQNVSHSICSICYDYYWKYRKDRE